MLRITRVTNREVIFKLSGRMSAGNVADLKALFASEANGRRIALDLIELTLVDPDAVLFLAGCEADGIELRSCPAYIRERITRERGRS